MKYTRHGVPNVGDRKGLLTIIEVGYDRSGLRPKCILKCKCDCGNVVERTLARWNQFVPTENVSCGCYVREKNTKSVPKIGDRFGRLVVTDNALHIGNEKACKCHCDCGNDVVVKMWDLKKSLRSCGCLKREKIENARLPIGTKIGMLMVERTYLKDGSTWCDCRCDCGNSVSVNQYLLKTGNKYSCGCVRANQKHGDAGTRLYGILKGMRDRCTNANSPYYKWYGGRGIKLCKEWLESYETFRNWAHTHGYTDALTIDRIDPNGDYCPENCRWSTVAEQNRNKRTTPMIEYNGKRQLRCDWAKEIGLSETSFNRRLRNGWTIQEAIETPNTVKRGWRNHRG